LPAALLPDAARLASRVAHRVRQGGQGFGSPARGHLNPSLTGWGFRGRPLKIAPRNAHGPRSAPRHDREANARYDPARLRSKSLPTLPLAMYVLGKRWRVSALRGPRQLRRRRRAAYLIGRWQAARTLRVRAFTRRRRCTSAKRTCPPACMSSAACGRRRGCRGPRRAETRNSSHPEVSPAAGRAGTWIAGEPDRSGHSLPGHGELPSAARSRCAGQS